MAEATAAATFPLLCSSPSFYNDTKKIKNMLSESTYDSKNDADGLQYGQTNMLNRKAPVFKKFNSPYIATGTP